MDLSVIVVNWNTRDLLARCLQSIEANIQTCEQLEAETLVVDNASADGSIDLVIERFPWARLIENTENVGFARANNQAIQQSHGRYVLLLNSDAQLVPDAVQNMMRYSDADDTIGIAGVCLKSADGSAQFCYGLFPTLWRDFRSLFGMHRWDLSLWGKVEAPRDVDWVSGACLMARKMMLDEIGLLDESYFMFGEEVDLCYRARQAGWRVCLVPSDPVFHIRAGSTGKTPERILRLYNGKIVYCQKHLGKPQTFLLRAMIRFSTFGKLALYSILAAVAEHIYQEHRQLWLDTWRLLNSTGVR